jgi:hypothetical protein
VDKKFVEKDRVEALGQIVEAADVSLFSAFFFLLFFFFKKKSFFELLP